MFLFTTPSSRETAPTSPVVDAIRQGAAQTGVRFDYLLNTAQRESSLDPRARAQTSSATGLFQFIEQTWLGLVKEDGEKLGLQPFAQAITRKPDGTYAADPGLRGEILALREDPKTSAVMAGVLTQRNRDLLVSDLGREPGEADLYIAHFLGPRGAANLIRAAGASPERPAAADFPDAAKANRSIFYDRGGRARGAGEVYALLAAHHGDKAGAAPAFGIDKPLAFAKSDGPAFHGLFRTEGPRGSVSDAVSRLWSVAGSGDDRGNHARVAARGGFFPRSTTAALEAAGAAPLERAASLAAALPPPRPADTGDAAPARRGPVRPPLDLTSFMTWRNR